MRLVLLDGERSEANLSEFVHWKTLFGVAMRFFYVNSLTSDVESRTFKERAKAPYTVAIELTFKRTVSSSIHGEKP